MTQGFGFAVEDMSNIHADVPSKFEVLGLKEVVTVKYQLMSVFEKSVDLYGDAA